MFLGRHGWVDHGFKAGLFKKGTIQVHPVPARGNVDIALREEKNAFHSISNFRMQIADCRLLMLESVWKFTKGVMLSASEASQARKRLGILHFVQNDSPEV